MGAMPVPAAIMATRGGSHEYLLEGFASAASVTDVGAAVVDVGPVGVADRAASAAQVVVRRAASGRGINRHKGRAPWYAPLAATCKYRRYRKWIEIDR